MTPSTDGAGGVNRNVLRVLKSRKFKGQRMKAVESRLEYCQRKAAEARARAEAMKDFEARRAMLEVGAMWDEMADVAERSSPSR